MQEAPQAKDAPRLSVAVITHNEAGNLPRTLASVQWADEIVVIDSGSTDATVEIARRSGARVFERAWPGFAAQKNFALAQCRGTWILSLDADEELTPELAAELQAVLASGEALPDAFRIKRRNLFLGRWVRHGGFYPDAKLRLFRNGAPDGGSTPQFGERPVHETVVFAGEAPTLRGDLIHHAYPTLSGYLEHMNRYSDLGAEVLLRKGRTSQSSLAFLTQVLLAPWWVFAWNYVFRLGFMDGREGLLLHLYQAAYTSWKYAKAWERARLGTGKTVRSTPGGG